MQKAHAARAKATAKHHPPAHAAHTKAKRKAAEHKAATAHAKLKHKLGKGKGEHLAAEPETPDAVADARSGQPHGDVGEDEDPDAYAAEPGEEETAA